MTYDRILLKRATDRLKERKSERRSMFEKRREEIFGKIPEASRIDREISASVIEALRTALVSGEDPKEKVDAAAKRNLALQAELEKLLQSRGYDAKYLEETPECEKCADSGYVGQTPCECLKKLYFEEQRKELSGLLKLGEETFEKFSLDWYAHTPIKGSRTTEFQQMSSVLDYCRSYAANFSEASGNLLFTGGTGLGKTFLSTCIAKTVFEKGYSVVYDTATDIFAKFESEKFSRAENDDDAQSAVRRYLTCDLLILDDLGTEMTTSFVTSALYYLINTRLLTGKSTIVSTNLEPEEIEKRYSKQIASRVAGEYKRLRFFGKDIRVQKLKL